MRWVGLALLAACACAARAQTVQRRVIKGYDDKRHADFFPFAVMLEDKIMDPEIVFRQICSGSLITSEWVISAAHCLRIPINSIRYGNVSIPRESTITHSKVVAQYPHPLYQFYNKEYGLSAKNYIGLLLVQKVAIKSFAKLSAVDYQSMIGHEIMVAGYGQVKAQFVKSALNKPLQVAEGMVAECPKDTILMTPAICLTSKCGKQQMIWHGDSGGLLLHDGKVAGVAVMTYPLLLGIYTPVSPYLQWIRHTMQTASRISP